MSQRFSAAIGKVGINPCVDVPAEVSASLGRMGYIPVRVALNGHSFRAGLVSLGGGRHRLFVNGEMRQAVGVDVGDVIDVELDYDPVPRSRRMPTQLAAALKADPAAGVAWDALAPSRRNEILAYLNSLKSPESMERNVGKVLTTFLKAESGDRGGG